MIGVFVITHAQMADGIGSAVNLIMGEQENFDTYGLIEGTDYDVFTNTVYEKIVALNQGEGVIVLVDFFGASPYNAVAKSMSKLQADDIKIRLVTGVNLPMTIEALDARTGMPLDELYKDVMNVAKEGVQEMLETLGL